MLLGLSSIAGILALLLLIPFIIIYLRKPKALNKALPSMMFLEQFKGVTKKSNFLQKLIRNMLFLIQMALLTILLISFTNPYINTRSYSLFDDSIVVLDTSASMTGHGNAPFNQMITQAKKNLGKTTTLITTGKPASIIANRVNPESAILKLNSLKPEYKSSDIDSALMIAISKADESRSHVKITVITDLRSKISDKLLNLIEQKGYSLNIVPVGQKNYDNVGIVDAKVNPYSVDFTIKNFNSRDVTPIMRSPIEEKKLNISAQGIAKVTMKTYSGNDVFELSGMGTDDFSFDNKYYLSNGAKSSINVLIVSLSESQLPVEKALRAINTTQINIDKNKLGTFTQGRKYDLIILDNYAPQLLLPSFYSNTLDAVKNGAGLIIMKQDDMQGLPNSLMPITFSTQRKGTFSVEKSAQSTLTDNVEFSDVSNPLIARPVENAVTLANEGSDNFITILPVGDGYTLYYGYDDSKDTFKTTPSYPIFWSNIVESQTGASNVQKFNVDTDTSYDFNNYVSVSYPQSVAPVSVKHVDFSSPGFYTLDGQKYSANIVNFEESDPSIKEKALTTGAEKSKFSSQNVKYNLSFIIGIIALALLFVELIYVKRRGDL